MENEDGGSDISYDQAQSDERKLEIENGSLDD